MLRSLLSLRLLAVTTLFAGCATSPTLKSAPPPTASGFPIIQGVTNASATQLAVVVPKSKQLTFKISDSAGKVFSPKTVSKIEIETSDTAVVHLHLTNLVATDRYELQVQDEQGVILDRRSFRSLDLSPRPVKIAIASCLYDAYLEQSRAMWKAVADTKPDLLFLIGDNVYAEVANGRFRSPMNEAALWIRYVETFLALDFYRMPQLIPTVVTWDDHDYGMKDGNAQNPFKLESKKVLEAFFPRTLLTEIPEFEKGPGVSSRLQAFGYNFILLDNRSFRDERTHFGFEQGGWLFTKLKTSRSPSWLMSGDQWFGAYHRFESYEGRNAVSFKGFMSTLKKLETAPVIFVSGDRHMSEVSEIEPDLLGYKTFEFTSSPLHSKTYASNWNTIPNRRQLTGVDLKLNFMAFDLTPPATTGIKIKGAIVGADSEVLSPFEMIVRRRK